ncbi:MAG: hypothetical protein P4L40_23735 [Terracidiphilus sp.]|nr:hypothetical protein [Terracidiphilus sp.]
MRNRLALCLLIAVLLLFARPALADRDQVQFGTNIVVPQDGSIHDAVCFFCSVDAKGTIDHDVVVFFGNVHIAGHSNHDVVNFFGNVTVDDHGSIGHDVVNFFGNIRLGEQATVGNDMVAMFGDVRAAESAHIEGNRVIQPAWLLLIPLCFFGGIIAVIVSLIRNFRHRQRMAAYAYAMQQPPPANPAPPTPPQA